VLTSGTVLLGPSRRWRACRAVHSCWCRGRCSRDLGPCAPGGLGGSVLVTLCSPRGGEMKRVIAVIVLGLSACGYPLMQSVVRRWGTRGAAIAECVCAGLAIRDATMVAGGAPGRLRRIPAALLFLELGAGVVASLAGLPPLLSAQSASRATSARTCAADSVRRASVAALFAIHTIRFGIYLRPDRGRRPVARGCVGHTGIPKQKGSYSLLISWPEWLGEASNIVAPWPRGAPAPLAQAPTRKS